MSRSAPQSLTPDQERAISAQEREVLVVAPVGSGKTEVLIQRVIRIMQQSAGKSFRLLAVTFTEKAAKELEKRTSQTIAEELWRVDANTIHGFAHDWLRRYGREIGISPDVVVLSDDLDRVTVMAEYLRSVGLNENIGRDVGTTVKPLLDIIDAYRTQKDGEKYVHEKIYPPFGIEVKELVDAYEASLRKFGAIDFPGMLTGLNRLIDRDKWVLEHFRTLYQDILVDEGQDLTAIQSRLLRNLAGDKINLFVVADDKQSIRGYAGGSYSHAQDLVPIAAKCPLYLRHNFRSSTGILRAAEAVLSLENGNMSKALTQPDTPPGRVSLVPKESSDAEANFIASWARGLLDGGLSRDTLIQGEDSSVRMEDIAVIGRTRWVLTPIVEKLDNRGMEYAIQTEAKVFLPESEARIFVDGLTFGSNRDDFPAARRVLDELHELKGLDGSDDPLTALDSIPSLGYLSDLVKLGLKEGSSLEIAMDKVVDLSEAHEWGNSARTLAEAWESYRRLTSVQDRSLKGYLWHLEKMQRTRPTDPGIRLLTIDRAKGLEFKAVAIIGARDGMLPHYQSVSDKEINEERRRLYVAMTRASRELVVSWPRMTVDRYGGSHRQQPSRFLVEAGLVK